MSEETFSEAATAMQLPPAPSRPVVVNGVLQITKVKGTAYPTYATVDGLWYMENNPSLGWVGSHMLTRSNHQHGPYPTLAEIRATIYREHYE